MKKKKGNEHKCSICLYKYETGKQLGGHKSKAHPKIQAGYQQRGYEKTKTIKKSKWKKKKLGTSSNEGG